MLDAIIVALAVVAAGAFLLWRLRRCVRGGPRCSDCPAGSECSKAGTDDILK